MSYYAHYRELPGGIWLRLYDFAEQDTQPRQDHLTWIADTVLPALKGSSARVFVMGVTCPNTGEDKVVAQARLENVVRHLAAKGVKENQHCKSYGPFRVFNDEMPPASDTDNSNWYKLASQVKYYRAVEIWVLKNNVEQILSDHLRETQRRADERAAAAASGNAPPPATGRRIPIGPQL